MRLGQIISWIGREFKSSSRLAFPDIAVVDRTSREVVLVAEVEESKAPPKLAIADVLATLLGDRITFGRYHREDLKVGPWTMFAFLGKSAGRGSGERQLQSLAVRLNEVKKRLATPNASIGQIMLETYRDESELEKQLISLAEIALREFKRA